MSGTVSDEASGLSFAKDGRDRFLEACQTPAAAQQYLRPHVEELTAKVEALRFRWETLQDTLKPFSFEIPQRTFQMIEREENLSALDEIESAKVLSLDIFDTCLVRLLKSPEDIFRLLGDTVEKLSGMKGSAFAELRIGVENALRKHGLECGEREDTSFESIYHELERQLQWSPETTRTIKETELGLERFFLRPDKKVRAKAWECYNNGIRIVYTSEMYLPGEILRSLLESAGFPTEGIDIFSSGETGLSKGTGNLYRHVLKSLETEGLVHVGDNPVSDGDMAKEAGIKAFLIQTRKSVYPDRFSNVLHAVASDPAQVDEGNYWEQFGYKVAGPIHFAFATHLYKLCQSLDRKHIHFLSRDGWFPRKVFKKLQASWGEVAEDHYLYASREFLGLGSMKDITRDDWDFILKASPMLQLRNVFERLGIPASDYEPACRSVGFDDPARGLCHHKGYLDPRDSDRLYQAICQCLEPFHHYRTHVSQQLRDYLSDTGLYAPRSMFVDVGWGGSSFKALAKLAPEGADLHGAYFALLNEASPGTSAYFTASFRERRMEILLGSIALLEFLFGSPEPTVRYMDKGTGEWLPAFREPLPAYDLKAWAGMEKGIMTFTDRCLGFLGGAPQSDGLPLVEDVLRDGIFHPSTEQLEKLGPLSHGEGWGTPHRLRMLPAFSESPDKGVIHEALAYGPWKPGLRRWMT